MRLFVLVLLLTGASLGQSINWVDDSAADSPLTYKGTITFNPIDRDNITCALTGHNHSDKTIVAYVVHLNVVRPDGHSVMFRHRHDHFFKDQAMLMVTSPRPLLDFVPNDIDCDAFGGQSLGHGPSTPSAHFKTTFVQFDDGSVWSDADGTPDEDYVMFQRTEALKYLQSLKSAYVQGGTAALSSALAKHPSNWELDHKPRPELRSKLSELQLLGTNEAIVRQLDAYLASAKEREAWLK